MPGTIEEGAMCKRRDRILIVDDNRDAATTLAFLLEQAGYEVRTAFNGETAIGIASSFEPDVCILDINMPGMNGYELARQIHALAPGRRRILATMTAYNDYDHLEHAASAGFDLHFTKPTDLRDLIDQMEDCLSRQVH
jgi:CheY-like chemotaxis protein